MGKKKVFKFSNGLKGIMMCKENSFFGISPWLYGEAVRFKDKETLIEGTICGSSCDENGNFYFLILLVDSPYKRKFVRENALNVTLLKQQS